MVSDLDLLRLQAVKTGLGIKYLAKDERISLLLTQLHELFSDTIILKGGTALNRGYLQQVQRGRFSEDIDIDYPAHQSLAIKINHLKTTMKKIVEFDVSRPRMLHQTIRFDCHYINQLEERDRVQVEFYLSEGKTSSKPRVMVLQSQYIPVSATLFSVYIFEELLSQKMIALYNRGEGKDIYDVFYALDLTIDRAILRNALTQHLLHYHIPFEYKEFVKELRKKIEGWEQNAVYIGNTANHFIPQNLRPDWRMMMSMLQEKIERLIMSL